MCLSSSGVFVHCTSYATISSNTPPHKTSCTCFEFLSTASCTGYPYQKSHTTPSSLTPPHKKSCTCLSSSAQPHALAIPIKNLTQRPHHSPHHTGPAAHVRIPQRSLHRRSHVPKLPCPARQRRECHRLRRPHGPYACSS